MYVHISSDSRKTRLLVGRQIEERRRFGVVLLWRRGPPERIDETLPNFREVLVRIYREVFVRMYSKSPPSGESISRAFIENESYNFR